MRRWLAAASAALLVGAAAPPPPLSKPGTASPARTLLPVKSVMRHIVNPAAELYWKASGEVDTAEGEQHRVPGPQDAARWTAVEGAAAVLQESGNLLMMQGRARDDGQWMRFSQALSNAGAQALQAAVDRSEAKTFEAGSALYDACFACHAKYIPRPANSLYNQHLKDEDFKPPK